MSRKRSREDANLPEDPDEDLPLGTHEASLFELQVLMSTCCCRLLARYNSCALNGPHDCFHCSCRSRQRLTWNPPLR